MATERERGSTSGPTPGKAEVTPKLRCLRHHRCIVFGIISGCYSSFSPYFLHRILSSSSGQNHLKMHHRRYSEISKDKLLQKIYLNDFFAQFCNSLEVAFKSDSQTQEQSLYAYESAILNPIGCRLVLTPPETFEIDSNWTQFNKTE